MPDDASPTAPLELDLGIAGVRVGHWTDARDHARTGCTVVLLPEGTIASGEVRGGAPASRELSLLEPHRTVAHVNAVVLSGGSAFGLAAGEGVMQWCEEHEIGLLTKAGRVPIVVGLSCFDLTTGDGRTRPTADAGYAAAEAAHAAPEGVVPLGRVGGGTGALVGGWRGPDAVRPGGVGAATIERHGVVVAAIFVVNAFGDIDDGGDVLERIVDAELPLGARQPPPDPIANTSIGVVLTNAPLSKLECHLVAQSAHDGLARALVPSHTAFDGDAIVVAATGQAPEQIPTEHVRLMAVVAVERAIRSVADVS